MGAGIPILKEVPHQGVSRDVSIEKHHHTVTIRTKVGKGFPHKCFGV